MTYRGETVAGKHTLWTSEGAELRPRADLYEYSETFSWGELSGGAYQTSVTLLADLFRSCAAGTAMAKSLHVDFAKEIVSEFSADWEMTDQAMREWMWKKFVECPTWFNNQIVRVLREDAKARWISAKPGAPAPSEAWVREEIGKHLIHGIGIRADKVEATLNFLAK